MTKNLRLRREVLSNLTSEELAQVVGGDPTHDGCNSYTCPDSHTCPVTYSIVLCEIDITSSR